MWLPRQREVRDIRVYVEPEFRGQGFGYLIVSFIKAYFFPWRRQPEDVAVELPLGGCRDVRRFTVLPSANAKKFYRDQGFILPPAHNKHVFEPQLIVELYDELAVLASAESVREQEFMIKIAGESQSNLDLFS